MALTKNQSTLMWVLTALLAAIFVFSGITKLIGMPAAVVEGFARMGYRPWFRIFIGVIEVLGGIGLLTKRAAEAGSFLVLVMLGAIVSCFRAGESILPPLITLLALGGLISLRAEE